MITSELVFEIDNILERREVMQNYRSFFGTILLAAIMFMFPSTSAVAKDYRVILGAGIGGAPDYEGSDDYDVIPIATVQVRWFNGRYFDFQGNSFKMNLIASHTWSLGPSARYQFERDDPDNEAVDRLRDVNSEPFLLGTRGSKGG